MSSKKDGACDDCGGTDFETQYGQAICTGCGLVKTGGCSLEAGYAEQCGQSSEGYQPYARSLPLKYAQHNDSSLAKLRPFNPARQRLKQICSILHCKGEMTSEAKGLLDRVAELPNFRRIRQIDKLHTAVACIYITCMQRRWPVSYGYMAEVSGYSKDEIIKYKKYVVEELNLTLEYSCDIADIVKPMITDLGFSETVSDLAEQIIIVCTDTWLTYGRNPIFLVHAAIFLAWKSEEFLGRFNIKFSQYAKTHKIKPGVIPKRIKEMIEVFNKLAKHLPWVSEYMKLNDKLIIEYIPQVCRYRKSMMHDAMRAEAESFKDEADENSEVIPDNKSMLPPNNFVQSRDHRPGNSMLSPTSPECAVVIQDDKSLIADIRILSPVRKVVTPDNKSMIPDKSMLFPDNKPDITMLSPACEVVIPDRKLLCPKMEKTELSPTPAGMKRKACSSVFDPPCFKAARRAPPQYESYPEKVKYKGDLYSEEVGEEDIPDDEMGAFVKSEEEIKAESQEI